MSSFNVAVQTNYFHVVDADLFEVFLSQVVVDDDSEIIQDWSTDADGNKIVSFKATGTILGIDYQGFMTGGEFTEEIDYDNFIACLQDFVDEDDAVIMMEFGANTAGDGYATATIITMADTDYIEFKDLVSGFAMDMLKAQPSD